MKYWNFLIKKKSLSKGDLCLMENSLWKYIYLSKGYCNFNISMYNNKNIIWQNLYFCFNTY